MSLTYKINDCGSHVSIVARGKVTAEQCVAFVRRLVKDPHCRPDQTALIDFRNAVFQSRKPGDILDIARTIESIEYLCRNKIAIVARSATLFTAELMSLHIRRAKHISIRVFLDLAAAKSYCLQGLSARGHKPRTHHHRPQPCHS